MNALIYGTCCLPGSGSDSDETSLSDETEDDPDVPACTPLAAFLSFKQEADKRRASQVQLETTGKVSEPPLPRSANRGFCCVAKPRASVLPGVRVSPGGGDVPPALLSGAVLPLPAAAAAGRSVPGPAEEAPGSAPPPHEGAAGVVPPAPQRQEQHHQQPGGGRRPAADTCSAG